MILITRVDVELVMVRILIMRPAGRRAGRSHDALKASRLMTLTLTFIIVLSPVEPCDYEMFPPKVFALSLMEPCDVFLFVEPCGAL